MSAKGGARNRRWIAMKRMTIAALAAILAASTGCATTSMAPGSATAMRAPTLQEPCAKHHVDRAWSFYEALNETGEETVRLMETLVQGGMETWMETRMRMVREGDPEACEFGRSYYQLLSRMGDFQASMTKIMRCDGSKDRRVGILQTEWKIMEEAEPKWLDMRQVTEPFGDLVAASCD